MCSLGINPGLVELLTNIGRLSSSRLLINGHLSPAFPIQRSVRQGDPLSMHLFVLYLHPLLRQLERVCGGDLVVAYADDISVIATSPEKIEMMRVLFSRFELVSGAKLNLQKTVSIQVGLIDRNEMEVPWLRTVNTVKILGVIFANSIRLMIKLNWDALIRNFSQQTWLHSMRLLTLHQKVTLLNTFITSKIWYLSATLPPYSAHSAKITNLMGTFLWRGICARVPMTQLARSRENGGLKLQLPALKCKALLINRHMQEIDSIPFYKSFILQNNPPQANPPADLPCLKLVMQNYPMLPLPIQINPSTDLIHTFFIDQLAIPRVERISPGARWSRIWTNIASKHLDATQRSILYLFCNEKTPHKKLLNTMARAPSALCVYCNSATIETLKHKLMQCERVRPAWILLQRHIMRIFDGWRQLSFEECLRPALMNTPSHKKIRILKLLATYITHVNEVDGRINVNALDFDLNLTM